MDMAMPFDMNESVDMSLAAPAVTPPTAQMPGIHHAPVAKRAAPPMDLPAAAADVPHVTRSKPASRPSSKIPDAMRVLIEPGVELEDVGLKPLIADDDDDAPSNLPLG